MMFSCKNRVTPTDSKIGPHSFQVQITYIDPVNLNNGDPQCVGVGDLGSVNCPRPFPAAEFPVTVNISAQALDKNGQPYQYNGTALLDVRPGTIAGIGPAGQLITFSDGFGEAELNVIHNHGATRIWVEDCGSQTTPGSFATGITDAIYFETPTISQLNNTPDNTTSPLTPSASNVCAISGDPRYGLDVNEDGVAEYVGYSHGNSVNAPPPSLGNFVEIKGCSIDEFNLAQQGNSDCEDGPLIVTGVGNEGFYLTDINSNSSRQGFNHIYAFNFTYPENLQVGDVVTNLRGSPVEFSGSTQISNPVWRRDGVGRGISLLPKPVKINPEIYEAAIKSYGRNRSEMLELEMLENAVVCMDNIAPAYRAVNCDINESGRTERTGCLLASIDEPLPPLCATGDVAPIPIPPNCNAYSEKLS